jgi:hypothetical protein
MYVCLELAYPNLLRTKRLGCCCCVCQELIWELVLNIIHNVKPVRDTYNLCELGPAVMNYPRRKCSRSLYCL